MNLIKKTLLLSMTVAIAFAAQAQVKTIFVFPDKAKIYINGMEVGNGTYTYKFKPREDFIVLKFEAPGYITKTQRLLRTNPMKTIQYTLAEDEAFLNSVGAEDGYDIANKNFSIVAKKELTDEALWRRLMNITVNNFENVEIRDKDAGWIRTAWARAQFSEQTVRTRLEIRIQFNGENERAFRCRLQSQVADNDCGTSDQCYVPYGRVLKKYESVISELQTSLGSQL